jgi:hypothetical protein
MAIHLLRWLLVPIGVAVIIAFIVTMSSPATITDPGSIVHWGHVKFSQNPVALFVIVSGFGTALAAILVSRDSDEESRYTCENCGMNYDHRRTSCLKCDSDRIVKVEE